MWVSNIGVFEILINFFCGKLRLIIVTEKPTLALHRTGLSLFSLVIRPLAIGFILIFIGALAGSIILLATVTLLIPIIHSAHVIIMGLFLTV